MGGDVLTIPCDVRRQREIEAAVQRAFTHFGRLDVLVNNAGTIAVGPMAAMTRADYQDALDTHFWAMYYAVEAALPVFRAQGCGAIVNVTSIGGRVSVPHLLPYCVSKFAAVAYSEGLHAELARENVTVTTVVPGLMRTGSPRNAWFKASMKKSTRGLHYPTRCPVFRLPRVPPRGRSLRLMRAASPTSSYRSLPRPLPSYTE